MSITKELKDRNQGLCELCNAEPADIAFTVSPKPEVISSQVALCNTCFSLLNKKEAEFHWRCLEGSIWSQEPAVQALSYRILYGLKEEQWAADLMSSADLDEEVVGWAMTAYEVAELHRDAFGNELVAGDNVVLVQALDVKGTNFTASKGTVVKKIKLVADNPEQIEGKINDQMIVILTRYVKKN
ncbi:MAG: PhnA domain-containing protein [Bacteroidia bacterium]